MDTFKLISTMDLRFVFRPPECGHKHIAKIHRKWCAINDEGICTCKPTFIQPPATC